MVVAGYIGIMLVASVLIVTNPHNYKTEEERKEDKNGKEV